MPCAEPPGVTEVCIVVQTRPLAYCTLPELWNERGRPSA